MIIKEISAINFRNIDNCHVSLADGLNVFAGKNAQGKTNLLETIFICAIGKSPRAVKIKDCLQWGKNYAYIKVILQKKTGNKIVEIKILENGKKIILINGSPISSLSQLIGEINLVYFFPDDLKLVKEAPSDRRKFMDVDISQASRLYFQNLIKYNKILAQRNKLLKISQNIDDLKRTISLWDEQLSSCAGYIILSRIKFLKSLSPLAQKVHSILSGTNENLTLQYVGEYGNSVEEIKDKIKISLMQNIEKDFALGYTSIGPHKDDIKIELSGIDVRNFASQGQQRTVSLALKFAEIELFRNESGEMPIVLLDDVLSELDEFRRGQLLKMSSQVQTIITCTDASEIPKNANIFYINQGKISKKP